MSKIKDTTGTSNVELAVSIYGKHTDILTQFGMRFPDGTIKWGSETDGGLTVQFGWLAENGGTQLNTWTERLIKRAKAASVDVHDYTAQHQLVKRTVVVAITEAEEI